jgi:uncharacterized protein YndB with AHSA1/START domain
VGGDRSALTINLIDYSPDSKATLIAAGTPMLLQIQHAATGSIGAVALCGQSPTSVAAPKSALHYLRSETHPVEMAAALAAEAPQSWLTITPARGRCGEITPHITRKSGWVALQRDDNLVPPFGRKERRCDMAFDFTVSDIIPAGPQQIYQAWLSSDGHRDITGGADAEISPQEGADFTAWDGYISGKNLKLEPDRRIVQSWRTSQFADTDPDSQIEVMLEQTPEGTRVTLHHTNVPDGHTSYRDGGWQDHYFEPMKAFFAGRT